MSGLNVNAKPFVPRSSSPTSWTATHNPTEAQIDQEMQKIANQFGFRKTRKSAKKSSKKSRKTKKSIRKKSRKTKSKKTKNIKKIKKSKSRKSGKSKKRSVKRRSAKK